MQLLLTQNMYLFIDSENLQNPEDVNLLEFKEDNLSDPMIVRPNYLKNGLYTQIKTKNPLKLNVYSSVETLTQKCLGPVHMFLHWEVVIGLVRIPSTLLTVLCSSAVFS